MAITLTAARIRPDRLRRLSSGERRVFHRTHDHADRSVTAGAAGHVATTSAGGGCRAGRGPGPASAVDARIAVYDGTTGKLIKDGGKTIAEVSGGSGLTVQTVRSEVATSTTGTTAIPFDDTIPQNTEGDEYITATITPTSSTNKLRIQVLIHLASNAALLYQTAALFQDTTANALDVGAAFAANANQICEVVIDHFMTAGTTSATTFKVRAGQNSTATMRINGDTARKFGGILTSSITITESVP